MRRLIFALLFLAVFGLTQAQELSESYSFVDGTSFSYPSDFLPFDEDYDRVTIANAETEIFVFVTFARTIESRNLDTLPLVMDYFFDDGDIYELGDEEEIRIGERDAIRFEYEADDGADVDTVFVVLPVGDNGSIAVVRYRPNTERGAEELGDEATILAIIESIRFVDLRGDLNTVLGNSFLFDDGLIIEHRDAWTSDAAASSLSNGETTIFLSAYTPEELAALELKADPIEVLYYQLFMPTDSNISFNPNDIVFETIRGREGVRYAFLDSVGEETVQRVYFVTALENGVIVGMSVQSRVGFNVLEDAEVQDMIQTLRPEGTLPPVTMMELGSSFNLDTAVIRFPDYWQARPADGGAANLSSLDVNVYVFGFSAEDSAENGYPDDLSAALASITNPLDDSVELTADDAVEFNLENGNRAAQISYTETGSNGSSYPRRVMLILLPDNSVVFVGIVPQPGLTELSPENDAEVRAIVNTIAPR